MTTAAVIPIKQLKDAKQRLSEHLSSDERMQLFTAMVSDVLTAVEACVLIDKIVVVTDDAEVSDLAGSYGAEVRPEPETPGLIEAVTASGKQLAEEGVSTMIFLPGDVPLVSADELEVVLEGFGQSAEAEFLIVPATDLGGSNCVACSPPDCMEFGFGIDSFRKHLAIAKGLGLTPIVTKLPGIGLDVDTVEDLRDLVVAVGREAETERESEQESGLEYSTVRFLVESGVLHRLNDELAELG